MFFTPHLWFPRGVRNFFVAPHQWCPLRSSIFFPQCYTSGVPLDLKFFSPPPNPSMVLLLVFKICFHDATTMVPPWVFELFFSGTTSVVTQWIFEIFFNLHHFWIFPAQFFLPASRLRIFVLIFLLQFLSLGQKLFFQASLDLKLFTPILPNIIFFYWGPISPARLAITS